MILKLFINLFAYNDQAYCNGSLGIIEGCVFRLNEDLDRSLRRSKQNGLSLNPHKSRCLVISYKFLNLSYFPILLLDNLPVDFEKLGVCV